MGTSPLHLCGTYAAPEALMRRVIGGGADINAADKFGTTPLMAATQAAQIDAVSSLLRLGADATHKNVAGETAFDLASSLADNQVNDDMRSRLNIIKDMLRPSLPKVTKQASALSLPHSLRKRSSTVSFAAKKVTF